MRLLADENVPVPSIRVLRDAGYDVAAVVEVAQGASDRQVLELARAENRVLVTFDADFGSLIFRDGVAPPPGVVFIRGVPSSPEEPAGILLELRSQNLTLDGCLTVVDDDRVRQRRFQNG